MKYALGNMLNGAGGLNADGLSLDLQFAADKTLTARKGPTPVFTRGSTGTFVGSDGLIQSAAINAARFDHDPVTFACKGLLIEESRTNLIVRSDDFANASWLKLQSTIASNAVTSPDGSTNGDTLIEDSTIATHQVIQSVPSISASQPHTISVFAKAASQSSFQITVSTAAFGTNLFANFILTGSGSIGASSGVTTRIEAYPNGWYRCSIAIASVTGGSGGFVQFVSNNGDSSAVRLNIYQGANAQTVHLWGAQLEAGAFPTSYIPTVASTVARSADVCSITGADFTSFYSQSEGVLLSSTQRTFAGTNPFIVAVSDNSFNNSLDLRYNSVTSVGALMNVSAASQLTGFSASVTAGALVKQAVAYKLNDCAYSANGASPIIDVSASLPTVSRINIGSAFNSTLLLNGHIAQIRYFRKKLSNAKLQTITT
jgi:hypothetical protein